MIRDVLFTSFLSTAQSEAERRGANVPQNQNQGGACRDAEKNPHGGQSSAPEDRGDEMDVQTLVVRFLDCMMKNGQGMGIPKPRRNFILDCQGCIGDGVSRVRAEMSTRAPSREFFVGGSYSVVCVQTLSRR